MMTFAAAEKGEAMQMNRLEHDLKAEAMLEVCLQCEGCSEPSCCVKLAEWIVKKKEELRGQT